MYFVHGASTLTILYAILSGSSAKTGKLFPTVKTTPHSVIITTDELTTTLTGMRNSIHLEFPARKTDMGNSVSSTLRSTGLALLSGTEQKQRKKSKQFITDKAKRAARKLGKLNFEYRNE